MDSSGHLCLFGRTAVRSEGNKDGRTNDHLLVMPAIIASASHPDQHRLLTRTVLRRPARIGGNAVTVGFIRPSQGGLE